MDKIKFKIALLDDFSYPISRHILLVETPVTEEGVMKAVKEIIPDITTSMKRVEAEIEKEESGL